MQITLRHGADVNCHQHEHGYTALMFAALSGNKDITWVMLEAGAETDVVNSVGRTAAQMAAFVGQHDCVTIINNFLERDWIITLNPRDWIKSQNCLQSWQAHCTKLLLQQTFILSRS